MPRIPARPRRPGQRRGSVLRLTDVAAGTIRTPDQRLRVFISSTLGELADERRAARASVEQLRLTPVMFELGARPHPPRALYRSYLAQSDVFVGIYWQRYGWVAPDMEISGLEDEFVLSTGMPRLVYVKRPAPDMEPRLAEMLDRLQGEDTASYKPFSDADELHDLLLDDLAILLTERFDGGRRRAPVHGAAAPQPAGPDVDVPRAGGGAPRPPRPARRRRRPAHHADGAGRHRQDPARHPGRRRGGRALRRRGVLRRPERRARGRRRLRRRRSTSWWASPSERGAAARRARGGAARPPRPAGARQLRAGDAGGGRGRRAARALPRGQGARHQPRGAPRPRRARVPRAAAVAARPRTTSASAGDSEAVRLFCDRAAAVQPGLPARRRTTPEPISAICRRLDGLPLAIELAAARVQLFDVDELRDAPRGPARRAPGRCTRPAEAPADAPRRDRAGATTCSPTTSARCSGCFAVFADARLADVEETAPAGRRSSAAST